jgi:hypothetical protein
MCLVLLMCVSDIKSLDGTCSPFKNVITISSNTMDSVNYHVFNHLYSDGLMKFYNYSFGIEFQVVFNGSDCEFIHNEYVSEYNDNDNVMYVEDVIYEFLNRHVENLTEYTCHLLKLQVIINIIDNKLQATIENESV